jgi:hypothetical protein
MDIDPKSRGQPAGPPAAWPPSEYYGPDFMPAESQVWPAVPPPPAGIPFAPQPPAPTPARQSRRTYQVITIVVVLFTLLSIGGCTLAGFGFYKTFTSLPSLVATPSDLTRVNNLVVVDSYYSEIESQNYSVAYEQLADNATIEGQQVDMETFIQLARKADQQQGVVSNFRALNDSQDAAHFTAQVTRGSSTYNVHLTLSLDSQRGIWLISQADAI